MELYQLDCVLHEPCEDQGWLYMAETPELPDGLCSIRCPGNVVLRPSLGYAGY